MADVSVLDVLLHDEPIGTLTRVGGDRILFAFNDAYIADPNRAVLGLGFKDAFGELITDFKPTQTRLLPFFANLLPEGPLRAYLADRAGVDPEREFFLLWVLGRDLPGAVAIKPADGESWPQDAFYREDDEQDDSERRRRAFRFSLAGVQLKFSAILETGGGLTVPAKGVGGDWIIKLPSRMYEGVPENEFSMMTLAGFVGIDVPTVRLVDLKNIGSLPEEITAVSGQALAVARFDRLPSGKTVHIEDFAQVFGVYPERKYRMGSARNIATVIGAEGREQDIVEFIRRLTFNTLIGNADMHLKNWSLIYSDRRHAALAPAYDLLSTIPYIPDVNAALNFSRTKRFDSYSADELTHLAAKASLPEKLVLDSAYETVERFRDQWRRERAHLPLSGKVIKAIEAHLETVPLWNGRPTPRS